LSIHEHKFTFKHLCWHSITKILRNGQGHISLSIAASIALTQALWLARLLGDLLGRDVGAVELRVDNQSSLALVKNPVFYERSKHIRVRYHFIRDCLAEGSIKARYINTKDQLADLLTKPLGRIKFLELCSRSGMAQLSHKTTHKT
jgi:hypothetical protein